MAWSAPSSVTTGDLITAATWNQDVVDNVQYVHDNRVTMWGAQVRTETSITNTSYQAREVYPYYPGDLLDVTTALYFAVNLKTSGGGATAYAALYDMSGPTLITLSEATTTATSFTWVLSSDFKGDADLPSGGQGLRLYLKTSNGAETTTIATPCYIIAHL